MWLFLIGSSSQYSKVATTTDTIAGYKIAEIGFDHVKLAASSNQMVNLPVGSQMKRRDNGPVVVGGKCRTSRGIKRAGEFRQIGGRQSDHQQRRGRRDQATHEET